VWSYSSLKEIEACPRRWMLAQAQYPDLWTGRGYPPMPGTAALFGEVVHRALETIVKALIAAGCESTLTAGAVQVLRELDGITAVAERALNDLLDRLDGNPRIDGEHIRRLSIDLTDRLPEARVQIQAFLSRTTLPGVIHADRGHECEEGTTGASRLGPRRPVGAGTHPEMKLTAEELRLTGRIDLLTVDDDSVRIMDYKTGAEDPSHLDQIRTYALLWDLDRDVNPSRRRATELTAAYSSHEVTIPAPPEEGLRDLERAIESRIAAADADVAADMPKAIPSVENCSFCQVRQLCTEYWEQIVPAPCAVPAGAWFDYEGVVGGQNGARSWWMLSKRTGRRDLLLRTISTAPALTAGSRIRVLGLRLDDDPDVDGIVGAMTVTSEVFILTDQGS
jgi:hypothetical protein